MKAKMYIQARKYIFLEKNIKYKTKIQIYDVRFRLFYKSIIMMVFSHFFLYAFIRSIDSNFGSKDDDL